MNTKPPPKFWWLILPLILLAIQIVIEFTIPHKLHTQLHSENGPIELLQFLILIPAFAVAGMTLAVLKFHKPVWPSFWVLVAALGCLYVAGEEVSWGQHFLNWATPEYWVELNDQKETNLHNTSSWLDQKPRLLLELGVIVGGLLLPLWRKVQKRALPGWLETIAPAPWLAVVAGIVLFIKLADKFGEASGLVLFSRGSEVNEFYIYYFLLLYLLDFRRRIVC